MIDQNSQFFAILTAVGEAKQANATALGQPWTFSQMGVGDANNTDPIPNRTQTRLINEWRRAAVNQVRTDPANPTIIITEQVIPADVGGKWIREIALYDADGDMVAVANCAPSFKPLLVQGTGKTQIIRMNFIVANTASVVLKIDPAIVLATREYVDSQIVEAMVKMDFKHSVLVATTANIVLSGVQTIDGALLPADARVLVKNQTVAKENGLYVVSSTGVWKRTQDADSSVEVTPGLFVSVETGNVNGDSVWQLVTDAPIVLGTTALAFEMAVGRTGVSAGSYANVTVDKCGRVIAGTNPATLAGHGITDAYTKLEIALMTAQATDVKLGTAKIAIQSQVDAGLDDETIVTPKKLRFGFSFLAAQNGYIVFPSWLGGLIIQWMQVSNTNSLGSGFSSNAYPIPFPKAALGAAKINLATSGGGYATSDVSYNGIDKDSFSWLAYKSDNTFASVVGTVAARFIFIGW